MSKNPSDSPERRRMMKLLTDLEDEVDEILMALDERAVLGEIVMEVEEKTRQEGDSTGQPAA